MFGKSLTMQVEMIVMNNMTNRWPKKSGTKRRKRKI
jgi:hypothetical protein